MGELSPDTTYYYIVGDSNGGYSKEFTFKSAPLSSQQLKNFTFAVFADLGLFFDLILFIHFNLFMKSILGLHNGDTTINFLKNIQNDIKLIWHGGDVSYVRKKNYLYLFNL